MSCKAVYYKSRQKTKETHIEKLMRYALENTSLIFEEQTPLCNITIVDFYIPDYRIAIYCDGDYWHSFPERQKRDKEQNETLQAKGYTVFRFKEKDILADANDCLNTIIRHLGNHQLIPVPRQLRLPTFE